METSTNHRDVVLQKSKDFIDGKISARLTKSQLYWVFGASLISAVTGSILLIPSKSEPSLGLFVWFMGILAINLFVVYKTIGKLLINGWTITLLLSYTALTLGFLINTKMHAINFVFLLILFTFINASLVSKVLYSNFITRYVLTFLYYVASKVAGIFIFLGDLIKLPKPTTHSSPAIQYAKIAGKIALIFFVTGFPIILIAVNLLKTTNADYAQWIDSLFSWDLSFETLIPRFIFILFVTPYLITEYYFLKELKKSAPEIRSKKIKVSTRESKYVVAVAALTIFLLNLFYILFVIAELRYDISDVRSLVLKKGFDSYSEFAVSRFWELIWVGILNLGIIYIIAKPFKKVKSISKFASSAFLINCGFLFINTLFLMYSAHKRLSLYEEGYGFTNKRLLAHLFVLVLVAVTFLIFAALQIKKQNMLMRWSFSIIILFFSLYIMLPTDYITNKLNYSKLKNGEVIVYDPLYSARSEFYANDIVETNGINSDDGLFIAIDLLKDPEANLTAGERSRLRTNLMQFEADHKNDSWREINISRLLLLKKIKDTEL